MSSKTSGGKLAKGVPLLSFAEKQAVLPWDLILFPPYDFLAQKLFDLVRDVVKPDGKIDKVDEDFVKKVITEGKLSGAKEINLEFEKEQLMGIDLQILQKKMPKTRFNVGNRGTTKVIINVKYE